jgi:hypothetical protein
VNHGVVSQDTKAGDFAGHNVFSKARGGGADTLDQFHVAQVAAPFPPARP